ncbi:MAG TPA: class I tRNA ligase family protein, partial [Candidatus Peribacterales bacterium]|nr:class I tRNA ligase family protein [Candidatus Peribacterales bacterium]
MFDPVDPKQSFPDLEKGILQYWREEDVFKRSIKQHCIPGDVLDAQGAKGCDAESFSFYDGPPFATGLPHYGHLLAGTIKDVIPRYQTMRGKRVERRFGWDCHGLPVENLVEKEQGLKSKKDIEAKGVRWFNNQCRISVQRYTAEWRKTVERMGRWVDMDWDYRTMDPDFMESIWWAFSELHRKGLIYEGYKPMHICPRCATPLSNFEVTLGYKDREDLSVIMNFPLVEDPHTVLLAWTTTPWSLPGNFWLAVGPKISYAKVQSGSTTYILAEKLVEKVFAGREYEVVGTVSAEELIGKRYQPLFPYFVDTIIPSSEKSGKPRSYGDTVFKVVSNEAVEVSDEDGTGIVHLTSATGEDSNAVAKAEGVDVLPHVSIDGFFVNAATDFVGLNAKPEGEDPMATDKKVIEYLKEHGRHFSHYTVRHSYPHCWRCDTPLLPYTTGSWFVAIEKIKQDLLAQNGKTNWVPGHIRDGRFGEWLRNARDWAISRNRYWGTPLPIWRCEETGEIEVIGSRDELMAKCPIRFTKLTVLRHAESEGNLTPIYQGVNPGTDLTEKGRRKAEELARSLRLPGGALAKSGASPARRGESRSVLRKFFGWFSTRSSATSLEQNVKIIYSSPLARAHQTAQIIALRLASARSGQAPKIVIDERLREVHFGDFEGKTVDFSDLTFVKERRAHKIEKNRPESIYHFDGMETWENVQLRIKEFMEEVLPKHRGEHIAIVTHADPVINIKHFFTGQSPWKLSHQPYPEKAHPYVYFFDHERNAELDLHKDTVDEIVWSAGTSSNAVEVTLVRHGETDINKEKRVQGGNIDHSLNETGRKQAQETSSALRGESFDLIICSDALRAVETAEILGKELGIGTIEKLPILRERNLGDWSGKKAVDILQENPPPNPATNPSFHTTTPKNGESFSEFLKRMQDAAEEIMRRFSGKKILLVSHRGTMQGLMTVTKRLTYQEACEAKVGNAEWRVITITPFMRRIGDVLDCWFESGSMPYAQSHFPFEHDGVVAPHCSAPTDPPGFPADFIAEGLDQTRGWFYTLMVLSTALFKKPAFKNCIVNGIVLAEDGKKMSKRLKNYPEPDIVMEKYGADAMRFTLMASPAVRGENLRFSEKAVEETVRRVILPLWNAYSFFILHA